MQPPSHDSLESPYLLGTPPSHPSPLPQHPGGRPADRYIVDSLGGPEAGSEPFFFPKFPVQSTVSLWMTTADMAASPGANSAPRRVPSTLQEKSRGFRGWVQRHTPPVVCTPGLFPHRTLHTAPLPGSPPRSPHPGSLQSLGSQAMPLQWAPPWLQSEQLP